MKTPLTQTIVKYLSETGTNNQDKDIYCSHCGETEGGFIKYAKNKYGSQYYYCNKCNTERIKKYRDNNMGRIYKINRNYDLKNPKKRGAWGKAQSIPLKPCDIRGKVPSVRHHDDYNKPKEVIFLCHYHHSQIHKSKDLSSTIK